MGGVALSGSGPSWKVMLSYEIRAAACKRAMKEEDLAVASRTSWVDAVVKERFFTTPLCWEAIETAKRRPDSQQEYPAKAPRTRSYDNSKEKGKDKMTKGKGKGKESKSKVEGCAESNAEGKRICFYFQEPKPEVYDGQELQIHACMRALQGGEAANVRVQMPTSCYLGTPRKDVDLGRTSSRG